MVQDKKKAVIKLFQDYSTVASEDKFRPNHEEGHVPYFAIRLKTLTPKQLLQRLPILFAEVKAGNKSDNLLK